MGKPRNKNRKGQDDDFDDEVDLDPLANQELDEPATSQKPAGKHKKKKKKDDWEDDVAAEIETLSIESKKGVNSDTVNEDDPLPQKIKSKKKKNKHKSDSEDEGEEPEEEIVQETKGKKKTKPMATFDMLMMDDESGDELPSDNEEEETPVIETKKEEVIVKEKDKKKKDKKKKKDQAEEDIDALLADLDKPKESKKKKKKNKDLTGEENEEGNEVNEEEQLAAEIESKMAAVKVVTIDDLYDDDEDDKKKKRKKKKGKTEEKDGEKNEEQEGEEGIKEEGDDDDESTVKTAAQKRKEKRDREKQKKLLDKKKSKGKKEQETGGETAADEAKPEGEKGEDEKATEEEEEAKPGKKKKKKEDEKEKKKKKAPVAIIKAQLQALKEEQERLQKEEEERIRLEEEKIAQIEEEKKKEQEKREKKKLKEKERKERLRAEGKLLTDKQKQDKRRAQEMLEAMKAQGFEIPSKDDGPKKRPVYDNKKKKKQQQQKAAETQEERTPSPTEETTVESKDEATTPSSEEVKPVADTSTLEEEKEEEGDDIKDDWAADSEEEEEKPKETETEKPKPAAVTVSVKADEESEEEDEEESEEEEEESGEEEESEESESESEEESEEDDELTPVEKARDRIMKRKEEAEKNKSIDNLRAPVICVLGHVDTGKTKILDKLRRTNVQDGEAGGITQQIGATNVPFNAIKESTKMCKEFQKAELKLPGMLIIDTPGHESFSNLRSRGSSLCDMAILVVDIMHGLEPQTIESINLLKQRKTPFVIALNKIDRLYQWKPMPQTDVSNVIKKQTSQCKSEFDERSRMVITEMAEQGLNTALFYENKNPKEYISLIPTSAHSGDGMGNLIALICSLCQTLLAKRLAYSEELQATAMEVKALPGLGTTVDVILVNGKLKEGDTVIVPGTEGPIVTQIRGLLMPQPMKELRVKSQWEHHKEVKAAQGVKIIAKDLDHALAGLPVYSANKDDEIEYYKEELSVALKEVLGSIRLAERGVFVQASTLGSMEALLEFLRTSKIPYAGINIGPVHKKDIMKASVMLEHDSQYAVILAFDVKVEREAQDLADSLNVTIFTADIIYHLFDKFTAYRDELKKKKQEEFKHIAVFPCKLRVLPNCIFNSRDPIVCGVSVESGFVKVGTPICIPSQQFLDIGHVSSIENNNKPVDIARKGMEVCIKIEAVSGDSPKMFGRHFDHTDLLYSKISRASIDAVKDYFREEMQKSDWQLIVELKKLFQIL